MTATTDNRELRAKARDAYSRIIHALADIVYVPTPDDLLGREMISREPVMRQVMRIREAADELAAILSARQEVGAVEPVGYMDPDADFMLPRKGQCVLSSHVVLVRDPHGKYTRPIYLSPTHTSEARDAVADATEDLVAAARAALEALIEHGDATQVDLEQSLRNYDAAMRQEGGTP